MIPMNVFACCRSRTRKSTRTSPPRDPGLRKLANRAICADENVKGDHHSSRVRERQWHHNAELVRDILPVILINGEECSLWIQITDIHQTLLRVSRVCDSVHTVTVRKDGWTINTLSRNRGSLLLSSVYRSFHSRWSPRDPRLLTLANRAKIVGKLEQFLYAIKRDLSGAQLQEKNAANYGALKTTLETIAEMRTSLGTPSMEKASPIVSHWRQPYSHVSLLDVGAKC